MTDLEKQVSVELRQLQRLLDRRQALISSLVKRDPTDIEMDALGAFLHAMYNGIELTLTCVARETGREVPSGSDSHRRLLISMTSHPRVLSDVLIKRLGEYLSFRHFFRHGYTFNLDWSKMMDLVQQAPDVLTEFRGEVSEFVSRIERD